MNGINRLGAPIITGRPDTQSTAPVKPLEKTGESFGDMLSRNIAVQQPPRPLTFSKHAQIRTEQRGIWLSKADMARLDDAVGIAQDKGLTDTLVYMDNTAFIVNIPNKVVVTVVDSKEADNTVFTNIDGAVIV